jgi:putative oxidoreductase
MARRQRIGSGPSMRNLGVLGLRLVLGGYLATHGAQKLFGAVEGPGLDKAGATFEKIGLRPGRSFAALAATSELAGGVLTAAGLAFPVGPIALAGSMTVASTVHTDHGPLSAKGGYELPLTNAAAALALATTGPGRYSLDHALGLRLPRWFTAATIAVAAAMTGYSAAQVLSRKRQRTPQASEQADSSMTTDRERQPA